MVSQRGRPNKTQRVDIKQKKKAELIDLNDGSRKKPKAATVDSKLKTNTSVPANTSSPTNAAAPTTTVTPVSATTKPFLRKDGFHSFGNRGYTSLTYRELHEQERIDETMFLRHPSRIPGAASNPPGLYGSGTGRGSFAFTMQRQSNRNYTMRSVCLDQGSARFYTFALPHVYHQAVGWMPDSNLIDHAKDKSIVDGCHLDLIDTGNTLKLLLTPKALEATVKSGTKCLFLYFFEDPDTLAEAIETCADSLQCISLVGCTVSEKVFWALGKCPNLSGITITTEGSSSSVHDKDLASLLKARCATLKWIFVDSKMLDTGSWTQLADNEFPLLEVLWTNNVTVVGDRRGVAVGDHAIIRRALKARGPSLMLCMVNPNKKVQTRYHVGGKSDQLTGNKIR
jgi:hypothetical protein